MIRPVFILGLLFTATHATAQSCPDFFRFVDFGLQDSEGRFIRGGPIFRGESLEGRSLLLREQTQCRAMRDIASDGHGNPVPVVTSMTYDAKKTDVDLTSLRVSYVEDTWVAANDNGRQHRRNLVGAAPVKGQNSLCVASNDQMSCQVVSPYLTDVDLVIYCNLAQCRMPVLAVSETIQISADWAVDTENLEDPERAGDVIFEKVQEIHAFLEPLTSGL